MRSERDPRWVLVGGIPALWVVGLATLTIVGAAPGRGWRINRALDAESRGETALAARELDRIAASHPEDARAWLRAGRAWVADGQPREGAERLERASSLDPSSITTRYDWAKSLMAAQLDEEAVGVLEDLLERKPDHADARFLRAAIEAGRGNAAVAAEQLGEAVDAGCSNPDRWRFEPRFDAVRADPRFLAVARDRWIGAAFAEARP